MKKCPYCGLEFGDELGSCPVDGRQLVAVTSRLAQKPPTIDPHAGVVSDFVERLHLATPRVWATYGLIGLNVAVFALMLAGDLGNLLDPSTGQLIRWGADFPALTAEGEWWRLLTSCFVHVGIVHLGLNMLALYYVGLLAERLFGNRFFVAIYLAAGLTGSLCSMLFNPDVVCAGASGAIFGVYGAVGGYLLRERAKLPRHIYVSLGKGTLWFVGANLAIGFTISNAPGSIRMDMAAHVGGMLGGFVFGLAGARPLELEWRRRRTSWAIGAMAAVGVLVFGGLGMKARNWRAEGDESYLMLATLYHSGKGIPKDVDASVKWFRKAAETGDARAQYALGDLLLREKKDAAEAMKWFAASGEHGDLVGYWRLAEMHLVGEGVKTNFAEALKWYLRLDSSNEPAASFQAARIYEEGGPGVPKDYSKAIPLALRAVEGGVPEALRLVSLLYYKAEGADRSPGVAVKWAEAAAERGDVRAMRMLGTFYLENKGVPQDPVEACKWLTIAESIATEPEVKKILESVEQQLPAELRAEVARRVEAFKSRNAGKPKKAAGK